jgi:hypothetical protein
MTQSAPQEQHVAAGLALDPTVPNPARIWNYWVGGKDHFDADRALAEQFGQVVPKMPLIARLTRQFLAVPSDGESNGRRVVAAPARGLSRPAQERRGALIGATVD